MDVSLLDIALIIYDAFKEFMARPNDIILSNVIRPILSLTTTNITVTITTTIITTAITDIMPSKWESVNSFVRS